MNDKVTKVVMALRELGEYHMDQCKCDPDGGLCAAEERADTCYEAAALLSRATGSEGAAGTLDWLADGTPVVSMNDDLLNLKWRKWKLVAVPEEAGRGTAARCRCHHRGEAMTIDHKAAAELMAVELAKGFIAQNTGGTMTREVARMLVVCRALLALQQTVDAKEGNVARWAREHRAEIDQAYRDEFGLPDGMDRNLLHAALWEIVRRIENCGASPALTHAVVLASDLMGAVGNEFNKPRAYDLVRVVEAVGSHNTWSAVCEKCQREWLAVYPAGTRTIACPGCGHCNDTPEAAVRDAANKATK